MKYFGTVKTFDSATGRGEIRTEAGGDDLRFEKSAISWGDKKVSPTVGPAFELRAGRQRRAPAAHVEIYRRSNLWGRRELRLPP